MRNLIPRNVNFKINIFNQMSTDCGNINFLIKFTDMARFLLVFGILKFFWTGGYSTIYDNYTLIKFYTNTKDQLLAASRFHDPQGKVDVFKSSRGLNDTLDLLVPPDRLQYVDDFGKHHGLLMKTKQHNYGRTFEDITSKSKAILRLQQNFSVFAYHSFNKINEHMQILATQHPDVLQLENVGNSFEGRPMRLARISSRPGAGNPVIFIDAGIHSREWVAPAMAVYLIDRLVSNATSRQSGEALNGVDWLILPVVNPDGYEFSQSNANNRFWRKTRSRTSLSNCIGVDGNRNYNFYWGTSGSSHNPCDIQIYCGPRAFSEPETQIVRNIMLDNKSRIKLYVSLHSYGQYLVYPWGYTGVKLPATWKKLDQLARSVSDAVERAGGDPFQVLSAGKWYPAAGGSDDYAFGAADIPYSYTMELTDEYDFTFPQNLLREVLPQFYEGFKRFAAHIRTEFASIRNITINK